MLGYSSKRVFGQRLRLRDSSIAFQKNADLPAKINDLTSYF
jgi:hypothetical protein